MVPFIGLSVLLKSWLVVCLFLFYVSVVEKHKNDETVPPTAIDILKTQG